MQAPYIGRSGRKARRRLGSVRSRSLSADVLAVSAHKPPFGLAANAHPERQPFEAQLCKTSRTFFQCHVELYGTRLSVMQVCSFEKYALQPYALSANRLGDGSDVNRSRLESRLLV